MRKDYSADDRNFPFKLLSKSCGAFKGPELLTASIPSTFPSMHAYRILFLNVYTYVGPKPLPAIQRQKDFDRDSDKAWGSRICESLNLSLVATGFCGIGASRMNQTESHEIILLSPLPEPCNTSPCAFALLFLQIGRAHV